MNLDLRPLEGAVAQLVEALALHDRVSAQGDRQLQRHMRAATIQAFEFSYEVTFKMLKRHLEEISSSPETVRSMTFNSIIREAFGQDLVCSDISVWRKYRKNRGITSHTYDEDKAQEVFECAMNFVRDAQYVLIQLQRRNESSD